jgi:hypothetical protein
VKPLVVHTVLLVMSSGLAYAVWNKAEPAPEKQQATLDVWSGSQASFTKLSFESKTRKVRLEGQKDALGYYYVASVDKEDAPAADPHAGLSAHDGAPLKAPDAKEPKKETSRFVSVKAADTLVKSLAPLKAVRAVGKVEPARNEEFGLDKPEGTLKVTLDGKEHVLVIGGTTPGGSERYARYQNSGEVFAISGDIAQSLMSATRVCPSASCTASRTKTSPRCAFKRAPRAASWCREGQERGLGRSGDPDQAGRDRRQLDEQARPPARQRLRREAVEGAAPRGRYRARRILRRRQIDRLRRAVQIARRKG